MRSRGFARAGTSAAFSRFKLMISRTMGRRPLCEKRGAPSRTFGSARQKPTNPVNRRYPIGAKLEIDPHHVISTSGIHYIDEPTEISHAQYVENGVVKNKNGIRAALRPDLGAFIWGRLTRRDAGYNIAKIPP